MSRAAEKGLECYNQNPASGKVEDLQLTGTGGRTASFTNAFKRGKGDLYLEKELVAATGFNPDELPEGNKFSFTIALSEGILDDVKVQVTYKGKEAKEETLDNGTLTVQIEAEDQCGNRKADPGEGKDSAQGWSGLCCRCVYSGE